VYGPLAEEMRPNDARAASILEHVIEKHVLWGFAVENDRDQRRLLAYFEGKDSGEDPIKYVTLLHAGGGFERPRELDPWLRDEGFSTCVSELFDAPQFVRDLLCQFSSLREIPVHNGLALQRAQSDLDRELSARRYTRYLLGEPVEFHTIYKSRYGKSITVSRSSVKASRVWPMERASERGRLEELQGKHDKKVKRIQECNEQLEEVKERVTASKGRLQDLKAESDALAKQIQGVDVVLKTVEKAQAKVVGLGKELGKMPQEAVLHEKLRALTVKRIALLGKGEPGDAGIGDGVEDPC
jgi:hypothetical protein